MLGGGKDEDGNPILDKEGGTVVQPEKGFVVKTWAQNVGKIFINMCSHEWIEGFTERSMTEQD